MLNINYDQYCKVRQAKAGETTLINTNYELLAKVLEAKAKKLNCEIIIEVKK